MSERDLREVRHALSGRSWDAELADWVHGTGELPLRGALEAHGVKVLDEPAQAAQALGLRVSEGGGGIHIRAVLRGGAAEQAGFSAGDEWLGIECGAGSALTAWRLMRLDDLAQYAAPGSALTALVARDKRLLRLKLVLPRSVTTWRLTVRDGHKLGRWLAG
jgi:predicted metalloprotease with PDZ domain